MTTQPLVLLSLYGTPTRVGEVGREASHNPDPFSQDAALTDHYSHSGCSVSVSSSIGTISSHRQLLHYQLPSITMPPQLGSSSSSGAVLSLSLSLTPIAGHGPERQSVWSEKTHAR
jgi:hypothetical protein